MKSVFFASLLKKGLTVYFCKHLMQFVAAVPRTSLRIFVRGPLVPQRVLRERVDWLFWGRTRASCPASASIAIAAVPWNLLLLHLQASVVCCGPRTPQPQPPERLAVPRKQVEVAGEDILGLSNPKHNQEQDRECWNQPRTGGNVPEGDAAGRTSPAWTEETHE